MCSQRNGWVGRWLGSSGPEIDNEVLRLLKTCSVYGATGLLSEQNTDATLAKPIAYGRLYTGLHLETPNPESLIRLCDVRLAKEVQHLEQLPIVQRPMMPTRTCRGRKAFKSCR